MLLAISISLTLLLLLLLLLLGILICSRRRCIRKRYNCPMICIQGACTACRPAAAVLDKVAAAACVAVPGKDHGAVHCICCCCWHVLAA
jgi:hypothetical protein